MRWAAQYSTNGLFRNSLPLSESRPRILNGRPSCSLCSAASTVWARLSRSPAQLTQPVATSTTVSVYRNGPCHRVHPRRLHAQRGTGRPHRLAGAQTDVDPDTHRAQARKLAVSFALRLIEATLLHEGRNRGLMQR